jgi:hypothetical protein
MKTNSKQFATRTTSGARDLFVSVEYETPLFVVHEPLDVKLSEDDKIRYFVTHKPSGASLSRFLLTLVQAKELAKLLEELEVSKGACFGLAKMPISKAKERFVKARQKVFDTYPAYLGC